MKFVALAAFAATASAWEQTTPGPGKNPNLDKVLEAMPTELQAMLSYVPQDYMAALIGGDAWLPTVPSDFLAIATGIPSDQRELFSSKYVEFISDVSSLLPTPADAGNGDENDANEEAKPTGSEEEESQSDEDSQSDESESDEVDSDEPESEDSSSGASLVRPIAAIAMVAAAVSYF
ncbi:hypothetical protein IWW36_002178 [Coemansia brasiliensis]|uniref:Uncharacterized protein n=1 Tax=Coemansia brasiliensis TaxID=2650707 RepID=A0A9W8IGD8_9FUNG|nr:hypothetical protein IWW36_002178 [Coemansia brasiliensis]